MDIELEAELEAECIEENLLWKEVCVNAKHVAKESVEVTRKDAVVIQLSFNL